MVQDLSNPMLAQVPHVLLAAHARTIMGVETNGMQFYPELLAGASRSTLVYISVAMAGSTSPPFTGPASGIGSLRLSAYCPSLPPIRAINPAPTRFAERCSSPGRSARGLAVPLAHGLRRGRQPGASDRTTIGPAGVGAGGRGCGRKSWDVQR